MVNATEMGKPFGKLPADYLRLKSTTEFRQVLEGQIYGDSHISDSQILNVVQGSSESGGGTWMHEDLAIHYAMWLAPAFGLWVVQTINEYLQKGFISKNSVDLSNPLESAKKLLEYTGLVVQAEEERFFLDVQCIVEVNTETKYQVIETLH
jgi:hypothetical protein